MGICSSVDVQKSPLSSSKRPPSSLHSAASQPPRGGDPYASSSSPQQATPGPGPVPAVSTSKNQQGDGPAANTPRNINSGAAPYASVGDHHRQQQQQQQSSARHLSSNNNHRQTSSSNRQYQTQPQSSSHQYQQTSPVHTADQAYHQSRHRAAAGDRHRAATDYRDDYRHRGESPRHSHRTSSKHHHQYSSSGGGNHHQQSPEYYHQQQQQHGGGGSSSSPRSTTHSSRFGSARRKTYTVVPCTLENLQQHTRSYTTPKMHTVHDVIEEAVAEDKAARRSENFDMSDEEPYNFSEAGSKPFTTDRIPVQNDNGISSERSMARSSRRRTRTGNSATSGPLSSTGSDGGAYASYETQDSYGSSLPTGLHTPSYSRSRMRLLSQGSTGTVQTQFNGSLPAHHAKGGGAALHTGSSSRLGAPGGGGNLHSSVSRSITDVPSIPEPHVAQHGHHAHSNSVAVVGTTSHNSHHMHSQQQQQQQQRGVSSSQRQVMSTSTPRGSGRSGTPQPNGNLDSSGSGAHHQPGGGGMQQQHQHLLGAMNPAAAATPTSMYAQHGDATPPPHNLSSADYGPDSRSSSRHPHASYVPNGNGAGSGQVDSPGGHAANGNGAVHSNGGSGGHQQDIEYRIDKRNDFNQYLELEDTQKSGGAGGGGGGLGYTAAQRKQPLHSLSESY